MKKKFLQGIVKRHPDGFGFLLPENKEHADVYLPRHTMKGIMSHDRVLVEVEPEHGGERFRGEIVRVLSRGTKRIVGHFAILNDNTGLVRDEGSTWGEDLRIPLADSLGAKAGDLVAAEITKYPEEGQRFTGRITEVIGQIEDPLNDIRRVVLGSHLPDRFSDEALREAKQFPEQPTEKDFVGRRDLRALDLITIDGVTAKDFDDAVLVEKTAGGFRLFVAIADVSHYVRPGTAIDKEAYERGTSVYFPNFVVPMLPEALSNGLCSLNPHVPRLCLVAEMNFDHHGEMTSSEFFEGVMESKARVTYGQAQEVVDGIEVPSLQHVRETILRCADLARILMKKRFAEGSLDLEIPETQLQIDGSGRPVDVMRSERLFSHRLIEELMLAANVATARFLSEREVPALYRVHEPPKEDALKMLEKYLEAFGGRTKLEGLGLQKKIRKALDEFEGQPQAEVLHILTLRSLSQAKYQLNNVGHFGLGFEHYTHFTSPIRRYPDLIVHRLIKNQVLPQGPYRLLGEDELMTAGTWLSACEQRSVKAERQVMAIKKARFMEQFLGREFEGVISSVAKFGVFVLLREYDIDGLLRLEDLSPEKMEFDEEHLRLVAKRSGRSFSIGDSIRVVVAATDTQAGQISFMPVGLSKDTRPPMSKTSTATSAARGQASRRDSPKHRHPEKRSPEARPKGADSSYSPKGADSPHGPRGEGSSHSPRGEGSSQNPEGSGPSPRYKRAGQRFKRDPSKKQRHEPRASREESAEPSRPLRAQDLFGTRRYPTTKKESEQQNQKSGGPSRSRKLRFADQGKVRLNDFAEETKGGRGASTQSHRKDSQKRDAPAHDRGGVREARVPQRGGKGPTGKVSSRKAQRQRRRR